MMELDLTATYALAVSGGVDSMVMLHKFASTLPRPNFFVVTVNHNIRAEAQADCDFVRDYCKTLNTECRIINIDVPAYSVAHKLSEETAARILRYNAFNDLACDYVCLAHHLNDNAETVLMHILRGSGARGATGIRVQNGKYVRPLLDMTRQQIEQYATEHNVPYVHDKTNDETKYTRNFIRKNILPKLKEVFPAVEQNIVRFAENIAQDNDYLDSLVDTSNVIYGDGYAKIPTSFAKLPKPLSYRTVSKVFAELGVNKDIEKTHIEALIDLANGAGGRKINLPFCYVATNDYDYVTIEQPVESNAEDFEIPFAVGVTTTPVGIVSVSQNASKGALMFDLNKLPQDAVFRLKRQGDNFTKFGGGAKSLKKYLIDKKISQRQRNDLLLVAKDSEVYVICGVEISDKVRVDGNSAVYYITLDNKSKQ